MAVAVGVFLLWWCATLAWWGLAFADLRAAPEWMLRAQMVCFGARADGLPEPFGWAALIVGPASMLGGLLALFHEELGHAVSMTRMRVWGRTLFIAVLVATAAQAAFIAGRIKDGMRVRVTQEQIPVSDTRMPDAWPRGTTPAPAVGLVDQHGDVAAWEQTRGRVVLLTYAFAHCQTICPTLLRRVMAVQQAHADTVELWIVTLDPWRDTPAALPRIAEGWKLGANQRVLSGAVVDVERVLDAYGVSRGRDTKSGDVAHPALVTIIDGAGARAYDFNGPTTDWIEDAIARVR